MLKLISIKGKSGFCYGSEDVIMPKVKGKFETLFKTLAKMGMEHEYFYSLKNKKPMKCNIQEFIKYTLEDVVVPDSFFTHEKKEWQADEPYTPDEFRGLIVMVELRKLYYYTDIDIMSLVPKQVYLKSYEQSSKLVTHGLTVEKKEVKDKRHYLTVLEKLMNYDYTKDTNEKNIVKKLYFVAAVNPWLVERSGKIGDTILSPLDIGVTNLLLPFEIEEERFIIKHIDLLCREYDIEDIKSVKELTVPVNRNETARFILQALFPLFIDTIGKVSLSEIEYENLFKVAYYRLIRAKEEVVSNWLIDQIPVTGFNISKSRVLDFDTTIGNGMDIQSTYLDKMIIKVYDYELMLEDNII